MAARKTTNRAGERKVAASIEPDLATTLRAAKERDPAGRVRARIAALRKAGQTGPQAVAAAWRPMPPATGDPLDAPSPRVAVALERADRLLEDLFAIGSALAATDDAALAESLAREIERWWSAVTRTKDERKDFRVRFVRACERSTSPAMVRAELAARCSTDYFAQISDDEIQRAIMQAKAKGSSARKWPTFAEILRPEAIEAKVRKALEHDRAKGRDPTKSGLLHEREKATRAVGETLKDEYTESDAKRRTKKLTDRGRFKDRRRE